jgi:hypothetical protein
LSSSAEEHCCEAFLFISPYHDDLRPRAAHLGGATFPVKSGIKTFEPRGRFTLKRDSIPEHFRQ